MTDQVNPANSANQPSQIQRRIFAVDDPTSKVGLVSKDGKIIVTHEFRKADVLQFIALSDSIVRVTEMHPKGEINKYDEEAANAAHFLDIVINSSVRKVTEDDAAAVMLSADEVRRLTREHRAKAIAKLYQTKIEVIPNAGATGYDYLFEPTGDEASAFTTARQLIGDPENPSFVLDHYIRRPGEQRRETYSGQTRKVYTDRKGDMPKRRADVDIRPGIELFENNFVHVTAPQIGAVQYSVTVGGHEYEVGSKDDRAAFLNAFLPLWKSEVIAGVVESFDTDIQD